MHNVPHISRTLTRILIVIFIFILIGLTAAYRISPSFFQSDNHQASPPVPDNVIQDKDNFVDISISSVGDILIHNVVYWAAYNSQTRTYNFNSQFRYVKPYLEKADITIANLETTLAGAEPGYSGYPAFNTPDEIIDCLKYNGVDILTAANNHRMDTGRKGFFRTVKVVRDKGLDIIGVKAEPQEKSYVIKNIKGINVAFLNFGQGAISSSGVKSLNGIPVPADMSNLINIYDPERIQQALSSFQAIIQDARSQGAEIIVVCMHWGNEYQRSPGNSQKIISEGLSDLGVNIIFGGHPHVIQPAEIITSKITGKKTVIFFSQGNFISDQRKETLNNIYTEQGMIANVVLRRYTDGNLDLYKTSYIPTWVNRKIHDGKMLFEIIPAEDALADSSNFENIQSSDIERLKTCITNTNEVMKI